MIDLIIIGAGGFAKSAIDSLDQHSYSIKGFVDNYRNDKEHLGYPILGRNLDDIKNPEDFFYFIAIGDNRKREFWYQEVKNRHLKFINIIDKSAIISDNAQIGNGCFVGKMVVINNTAVVGNNCIINTRALIEHGCKIGNHVNISTNTVLNGDVEIGNRSFIGSCSVINGQNKIGNNVIIGSGAVVTKNIDDNCTAVGIPAKVIKKDGKRL